MLKLLVPENTGIFKIAAEEFASIWKKATGKKLPVVTMDDPRSDMVVFGSDAVNPFALQKIIDKVIPPFKLRTDTDQYHLRSVKDGKRTLLFIAGARNRALLYGVYHFFEKQADCRWFWDGDIIPARKEISIDGLDVFESPRFEYRGLRYFAHRSLKRFQAEHWDIDDWKKEIDWCLKKRFNLFMLRIGIDDLFYRAFPDVCKYPKWEIPESMPRSYDDRTCFWPMSYRSQIRKGVLKYASDRDMLHPEDLGTMTHWYSRTPYEYLNKVKPDFLPQATSGYGEKSGLVWDIRQEKNLDAYFRLTETHIREYGSPTLFHTIGLAERRCYADRDSNQQMKLYTYRRIIKKLREKYPNAPLLIASWDFCMYWQPEEVVELLQEFDPDNTILLDYTSETTDELRNFTNWDVMGKFPWIFGLFHGYEPNSDVRGYYDITERRLALAREDDMCKGMIVWPEFSHTDTLMLEYLGANSWNPEDSNRKIASFIDKFTHSRYVSQERKMNAIWRRFLPTMKLRGFEGPCAQNHCAIGENEFSALMSSFYFAFTGEILSFHEHTVNTMGPVLKADAADLFRMMVKLDLDGCDEFMRRDVIDLARSVAGRLLHYGLSKLAYDVYNWHKGESLEKEIDDMIGCLNQAYVLLRDLLESHEDYSLNESLKELLSKNDCNPDFELTLKGNAENGYCRSYIFEHFDPLYRKEFKVMSDWIRKTVRAGRAAKWVNPKEFFSSEGKKIQDVYYKTPLKTWQPKIGKAFKILPSTLENLAALSARITRSAADPK